MNPEFDTLLELVRDMKERNRGFDVMLARKLVSLVRTHNTRMEQALKGSRNCEQAVAETLDALEALQ